MTSNLSKGRSARSRCLLDWRGGRGCLKRKKVQHAICTLRRNSSLGASVVPFQLCEEFKKKKEEEEQNGGDREGKGFLQSVGRLHFLDCSKPNRLPVGGGLAAVSLLSPLPTPPQILGTGHVLE